MRFLFIYSLLFLLSACSFLSPVKTPQKNYLLSYSQSPSKNHRNDNDNDNNKTILISDISSVPWLNTPKMAYQLSPHEINYFALHQWATQPAALLKPVIIDALQKSGKYKAVLSSPYTDNYDKQIEIKILDFQQEFIYKPSVYNITLQVTIINHRSQTLIKTKNFRLLMPCKADNPESGVIAANQMIQALLPQLTKFI